MLFFWWFPALSVEVVDGTGAGDAFIGAYLGQRLHDVDAAQAAALACSREPQ